MRDGDLGTGNGQHPGCGGADAAGAADDERHLAFKGNRVTHGEVLFLHRDWESSRRNGAMNQSAKTPAAWTIGFQRSISAFRWLSRAAGVACSSGTGSVPRSAKRWITIGSLSAA